MKVRSLFSLTTSLGLWASGVASAAEPAPLPVPLTQENQQLADALAVRLNSLGMSSVANLTIVADNGTITITGVAREAAAKDRILDEISRYSGVKLVRDGVVVPASAMSVSQAQFPATPVQPTPVQQVPVPGPGDPNVEPAPLGAPGMITPDMQAPPLPPYAWPTYAPYNNLSRVAYPQAYPYNAFPFIGPFYPFPKVPLGWRKVTMEWEDGHWYIGRASAPHDYWRVKFW